MGHHEGSIQRPSHYELTITLDLHFAQTGRKEGNVLFNNALNTFYLWLYGVRHMVKDHSDSEKGNLLSPHRLLFPISSKCSFRCTIPQPLLHQSWSTGTRNNSMGHHEGLIRRPSHYELTITLDLHLAQTETNTKVTYLN